MNELDSTFLVSWNLEGYAGDAVLVNVKDFDPKCVDNRFLNVTNSEMIRVLAAERGPFTLDNLPSMDELQISIKEYLCLGAEHDVDGRLLLEEHLRNRVLKILNRAYSYSVRSKLNQMSAIADTNFEAVMASGCDDIDQIRSAWAEVLAANKAIENSW